MRSAQLFQLVGHRHREVDVGRHHLDAQAEAAELAERQPLVL